MSITVRNLTKFYGHDKAIDDISFDVGTSEILGFLGPNGAGKTTTMKIVTCYMPPTSGSVEIDGYPVATHALEVRKKIGYLPELNPLYHDMNVLDYLTYSARLHGLKGPALTGRLREMVDACGIGSVRHKDIGELSKGFRQRVGLAQAMIHDPDVLILDEPTSGLDPNQIVEIRKLIRRLGRAKTVVLSTHILPEVQATCDRVIIVNEGKIVADGTPEKLQQEFRASDMLSVEIAARVENPMTEIFPVLASLRGVEHVEFQGTSDHVHRFLLHTLKGTDAREQIFRQAVNANWVLLELFREATTLEEVFHKLTMKDEMESDSHRTRS
ncbi:MAG: ATP-binding cassette domain-containing protein [Ignavibacteria bacterium]|nr:ATP-binding cassette domain-containing protein [Ignavibacteria bacterium]